MELRQTHWPVDAVHVVLDWEAMSTAHNAAPIQLAALTTELGYKSFDEYISPSSSEAAGLHVDKETMLWWDKQDPTVRARAFGGTKELYDVVNSFMGWLARLVTDEQGTGEADWSRLFLWGNGVEFDLPILRNAHEAVFPHLKFPVSFRNFDHVRTLYRCVPGVILTEVTTAFNATHPDAKVHDAYYDAAYHSRLVAASLQWLSGAKADYADLVASKGCIVFDRGGEHY